MPPLVMKSAQMQDVVGALVIFMMHVPRHVRAPIDLAARWLDDLTTLDCSACKPRSGDALRMTCLVPRHGSLVARATSGAPGIGAVFGPGFLKIEPAPPAI